MAESSGNSGFLTGMLVGAAAGAALALLYTPRSGRRAMELLRARGGEVGTPGGETVRERVARAAGEARGAADRTRSQLRDRYRSSRGEVPSVD